MLCYRLIHRPADIIRRFLPFFTCIRLQRSVGMDALAHTWPNTLLYAFPLVEMILSVLERVHQPWLSLTLVAPRWSAKSWYVLPEGSPQADACV